MSIESDTLRDMRSAVRDLEVLLDRAIDHGLASERDALRDRFRTAHRSWIILETNFEQASRRENASRGTQVDQLPQTD